MVFGLATMSVAQDNTFSSCYVKDGYCYTVTYAKGNSQSCRGGDHIVYNAPTNRRPKSLPRLGTNPQFGTLKNYTTTQEVYDHLKNAYKENDKGNAAELDKLWRAMGYAGFNDPDYTVEDVTMVFFDAGVTGMLGAGGNTYLYASISPGQDIKLKSYRMTAKAGCDIYIMEICGNAFFPDSDHNDAPVSGYSVVSEEKTKLDLEGNPNDYSITSFLKNGKCHIRVCKKPANKEGTAPEVVTDLSHNQQFGPMTDVKTAQGLIDRLC